MNKKNSPYPHVSGKLRDSFWLARGHTPPFQHVTFAPWIAYTHFTFFALKSTT
jgi:hypothetical protein